MPGLALLLLFWPGLAGAWSHAAHELVARIGWQEMSPAARSASVELLRSAPEDAGLAELYPDYRLPRAELDRIFFERASTWPDLVRGRQEYDHPEWHYVNYYWEQPDRAQPPRDRPDLGPGEPHLVSKLAELERELADPGQPAAGRALALVWLLHLVGDVHQPLHSSSRVSARRGERQGDRGGNAFELHAVPHENLHGLWDFILDLARPRGADEPFPSWVERTTGEVLAHAPEGDLERRLLPGRYRAWAREGFEIAKHDCYPPEHWRGRRPSQAMIDAAWEVARERLALAGYRLAELLEGVLGRPPH